MIHKYIRPIGLAMIVGISGSLWGADFIADGIAYNILDGERGTVEVAALEGEEAEGMDYRGSIVVPEIVNYSDREYQVVAIGDNAFKNSLLLTGVELPASIKKIGEQSFANCRWLTSCNIPENVEYIGPSAFFYCVGLESMELPGGLTDISDYSFAYCEKINDITIPEGIKTIPLYSFYRCSNLERIVFAEGLEEIGDEAFAYCQKLTSAVFPKSLRNIGESAFANCIALTEADLTGVESIGMSAFYGCKSLRQANLSGYPGELNESVFNGCSGLTTVLLPAEVSVIPDMMFQDCVSLMEFELPEGLQEVGERSFSGCSSLRRIMLPKTVKIIGENGFAGCSKVVELTGLTHEMELGEGAFQNLTSVDSLYIANIRDIPSRAFAHCRALRAIELNEKVERIAGYAFQDCPALTTIYVQGNVPPVISVNTFDTATELAATVYVQGDAWEVFHQASQWNRFANIRPTDKYPSIVSGIEDVEEFVSVIGSTLTCLPGAPEVVRVFDLQGRLVGRLGRTETSMTLPAGIYIIDSERGTFKICI